MSEIASKTNSRPGSDLVQPSVKKGGDAAHELLFATLFGGVTAAKTDAIVNGLSSVNVDADPMVDGLAPIKTDADSDTNRDGNSDIFTAMQAVAAMMSGQIGTGRKNESSAEPEKLVTDDRVIVDDDDIVGANSMMIGPMPLQQQAGTYLPAAETSAAMARMAFEEKAPLPDQLKGRAVRSTSTAAQHPSVSQSKMAALSSSISVQTTKSAEKTKSHIDSIDDMMPREFDIEASQSRSGGRQVIRPATSPQNFTQASLNGSKSANGSGEALIDTDGNMQVDSPDDFRRAVAEQTERGVRSTIGQSMSGESLSANAVRQMQAGGLSVGAQMSQQNNGQSSGQSGGFISASAGMTNGSMMEMLDLAQDNWTEMLLQRVEKGLAGGKDKLDFHLNPRNLGKMRISLVVQNERTNVHIQTETSAAAQLLSDAEVRLAQMMDASGVKFGNLTSQYNQNFGGNFSGQNWGQGREGGSANGSAPAAAEGKDVTNAEISVEQSENLINMQA